jgi:hypothetical protein
MRHHCFPPAIIFTNTDVVQQIQDVLTRQLYLTEIITAAEFDARVVADPNYPLNIHLNHLRVLVLRDLSDCTNRHLADIVLFLKAGLAYILHNKVGPTRFTTSIDKMYLQGLIAGDRIHFEHRHRPPPTISDELTDRAHYHHQDLDDPPRDRDNPNDEYILDVDDKDKYGRFEVREHHHGCHTIEEEFEEHDHGDADMFGDDDDFEAEGKFRGEVEFEGDEHRRHHGPNLLEEVEATPDEDDEVDTDTDVDNSEESEHHHHHHHHHDDDDEDHDVHQIGDDMFGGLAEDIDEDDLTVSELEAEDNSIDQGTEGD